MIFYCDRHHDYHVLKMAEKFEDSAIDDIKISLFINLLVHHFKVYVRKKKNEQLEPKDSRDELSRGPNVRESDS